MTTMRNEWHCEHCNGAFSLPTEMTYRGEWPDGSKSPGLCMACAVIVATIEALQEQVDKLQAVWDLRGGQ